jgi:ABC-type spermidine/putrescine transport system permease subunit II
VSNQASPPRARRSGRVLDTVLAVWTFLVLAFLFLPIIYIVIYSFNDNRALFQWSSFSTRWYTEMLDNQQLIDSVKSSLWAAVGSTVVAVLLGTFAGVALARRPGRWTIGFMALVLLILTTPEIVDAIGLRLWFVRLGGPFDGWYWPIWIGQSIFSSAVVTLIVRARMAGVDEALEHAAQDLYATPRRAFTQITLPLVAPAIVAGGLLAFTLSLDNVVITQFVSSPGTTTFPVYVFGTVRTVVKPDIASMSTVLLGLTLLALGLVAFVLRRAGDTSTEIAATFTGAG